MRIVNKWWSAILVVAIILINFLPAVSIYATAPSLTATPSVLDESLASGTSRIFSISISNDIAVDMEVGGLGQTPSGGTQSVAAQQDTSPYSARSWVTIDKSHLDIGSNQTLKVTVNVPAGTSPGEKYASIALYNQSAGQGSTSIISGIIIPLIFTIDQSSFTASPSGQITDLQVKNAYSGKAIDLLTYFTNTGNARVTGAKIKVSIKDSSQIVKWQSGDLSIAQPSVIPNYAREIKCSYNVGLPLGSYTATSIITLANGTVLSRTVSFTVVDPPPLPTAPTLTAPGSSNVPGPVIDSLTPVFQWNTVTAAEYYELTVTRDPYGASDIIYSSDRLTVTSFTLPSGLLFSGEKYRWQLTASNATGTSSVSSFYFQTAGTLPAVTTNAATNISASGATLNGYLISRGGSSSAAVSFEYGTTTSYGNTAASQTLTAAGVFSTAISGLYVNTTYHYRAIVTGSSTVYGDDMSFSTLNATTTSTPIPTLTPIPTPISAPIPVPVPTLTPAPAPTPGATATASTTPTSSSQDVARAYQDYFPAAIYEPSLVYQDFIAQQPIYFNAANSIGLEIQLSGTNYQNALKIIAGQYLDQPQTEVQFSAGANKGGTGRPWINFVGVRVEGATQGTAHMALRYTNAEINEFAPDSLFLSYFSGGSWHKCTNIVDDGKIMTISGDLPVSRLSGTVIGLGGSLTKEAPAVAIAVIDEGGTGAGTGIPWSLFSIVLVTTVIIGVVILVLERNRRKNMANS